MTPQSAHLTDEALDDVLLGGSTPSANAHLASCAACAARLDAFRSSVTLFNQASSAWSEARSNTISRELPARRSTFAYLPAWSYAAAFFLAVVLSFLAGIHRGMKPHGAVTVEVATRSNGEVVNRQQEIASDNAMLDAIASEISRPVPSPLDVYAISKANAPSSRVNSTGEVRD